MPHIDLLDLPYFEGISVDGLVSLVDLMLPIRFDPGAVIVEEGSTQPAQLFIATRGKVLISKKAPDGQVRRLAELSGPTLFGEIELFCELPSVCTAQAISQVDAFKLDRPTFDRLFAAKNEALMIFTFNVARVTCHRLAIADEMLTRVLADEDLSALRESIWLQMRRKQSAGPSPMGNAITGVFRKPT
ncbi:MAG: cyclic nucleotide-binding domain-containing protein [Myxococcota bacterium]